MQFAIYLILVLVLSNLQFSSTSGNQNQCYPKNIYHNPNTGRNVKNVCRRHDKLQAYEIELNSPVSYYLKNREQYFDIDNDQNDDNVYLVEHRLYFDLKSFKSQIQLFTIHGLRSTYECFNTEKKRKYDHGIIKGDADLYENLRTYMPTLKFKTNKVFWEYEWRIHG